MQGKSFVTPRPGSGGLNIRNKPRIDPETDVGDLNEGVRLDLVEQGQQWHECRVYVSTQVADVADERFVVPKPAWQTINIRSAPRLEPSTDVGDLRAGQRLELIERSGDWLIARVYVSAQFADVIGGETSQPITSPVTGTQPSTGGPQGSLLTLAELQQIPLVPIVRRVVPPGGSPQAITAANIWNTYGGLLEPLATKLGADPAIAVAVFATESGGRGFAADRRMIIRFENHIFWMEWGKANAAQYQALFKFNTANTVQGHEFRAGVDQPWQFVHRDQNSEWSALAVARGLNDRAAKRSISMGLPQIMGFNHATIGYAAVEAMFDAFSSDERLQVLAFFDFLKANPQRAAAFRDKDYFMIAQTYNGIGQENIYAPRIQAIHDAFHTLTPAL